MLWQSNRLNSRCLFCGAAWRLRVVEESINVQVDAQLAHLTVVVGVEDVLTEVVVLPDIALGVLFELTVLIRVGVEIAGQLTTWMTVVLVEGTKAMFLVDHVVHLQLW